MISKHILVHLLDEFRKLTHSQYSSEDLAQFLLHNELVIAQKERFAGSDLLPAMDVLESHVAGGQLVMVEKMVDVFAATLWDNANDAAAKRAAVSTKDNHAMADAMIQLAKSLVQNG